MLEFSERAEWAKAPVLLPMLSRPWMAVLKILSVSFSFRCPRHSKGHIDVAIRADGDLDGLRIEPAPAAKTSRRTSRLRSTCLGLRNEGPVP